MAPKGDPNTKAHILVVDDEKDFGLLISEYLTQLGFKVTEAVDGIHAFETIKGLKNETGKQQISLVVSDWVMPRLDGPGLLEMIKGEDWNEIGFILQSGKMTMEELMQLIVDGVDEVLLKPFSFDELAQKINSVIQRKKL